MTRHVTARVRDAVIANSQTGGGDLNSAARDTSGVVGAEQIHNLTRGLRAQLYGAGPLQELLDEPGVTDVLVNGPRAVWVDRGNGLERSDVVLGDESHVRALAVRLAATVGRRLDDAQPAVDARLKDGVRLHAILPPLAPHGTTISLRVPSPRPLMLEDLESSSAVGPAMSRALRGIVAARISFVVCGATGTGKTTVLGALLGLVPSSQRIVIIEEAFELEPDHPHVVHLQTRVANVEGAGTVGLDSLVRHSLRMRPDRVILGECRGAEIRDLLTAFNTGHEGGGTTLHANAPTDFPSRVEALGALAGMDRFAVAAQTASALRILIHLRNVNRRRWVSEIAVITSPEPGVLTVVPAWQAPQPGSERRGPGAQQLDKFLGGR